MDVIKKLIRLLQDDYKVGVEMRSGKPIIYIDPNKIDAWRLERDATRGDLDAVSSQMAEQLDASYPGLSEKFTREELIQLTKDSLKLGPFAHHHQGDSPICLINQPHGDEIKPEKIYDTFGLSTSFTPAHLIPLPGTTSDWAQFIGEHEGEHCNQDPVYSDDPEAGLKTLDKEIRSDRAALETLRKEGKIDIIDTIIAIRVLAAANGDYTHATSIFLDEPDFEGAKKEHFDAAERFREEMCLAVSESLGISNDEAEILRKSDPQKFAKTVNDALEKGKIPALRDMSEESMIKRLSQEMGISEEDFKNLDSSKLKDVQIIYDKLKVDGALRDHGDSNPHINKYIKQYISATKLLFIKDTTPAVDASPTVLDNKKSSPVVSKVAVPAPKSQEEIDAQLEDDLRKDAELETDKAIDQIVAKSLGLNQEQTFDLLLSDPKRYYDTLEKELQKGSIPLQTSFYLDFAQTSDLVAKKLGVQPDKLQEQPIFLRKMAIMQLEEEGHLVTKRDNPYLKEILEDRVKKYRQDTLINEKPTTDDKQISTEPKGFKSASEQVIATDCNLSEKFGCASNNVPVTNNPDNVSKIAQARTISANDGAYLTHGTGGP